VSEISEWLAPVVRFSAAKLPNAANCGFNLTTPPRPVSGLLRRYNRILSKGEDLGQQHYFNRFRRIYGGNRDEPLRAKNVPANRG
jgi:hypothetical protein